MKDLALFIIGNLVQKPELIEVEEMTGEDGMVTLSVRVDKEDMGRVIGKHGKIINAIRNVIKVRALKENKLVNIVLAE